MEKHLRAGSIAKERLEKYLASKLAGERDDTIWEFYTFLLGQAQKHQVDRFGYHSVEYQRDHEELCRKNKSQCPSHGGECHGTGYTDCTGCIKT
jgi:hypothetical protein